MNFPISKKSNNQISKRCLRCYGEQQWYGEHFLFEYSQFKDVKDKNILEIGCAEAGLLKFYHKKGAICSGIELSDIRFNNALLLDKKKMTLAEIAKTLDKHHATVLNAKRKLSDWMETDSNIESIYRGLEKRVDAIIGKYPDKFEKTKSERQLYISEYEELEGRYRALRGRHNLLLSEIKRLTPNYNAYFKRFKELETNNI